MKTILLILSTIILFVGCTKVSDEELRAAHDAYNQGALIIDVRTKEEFSARHVQDAINIPVQVLEQYYGTLPEGKELIVYCKSGSRSQVAAAFLESKGRKVYDVATQSEWEREIPAIEKSK